MLIPRKVKHRKQHHPGRSGQATGGTVVSFGSATGSWGTVTHFGIFDAVLGNLLFWGPLTQSTVIAAGNAVSFPVGSLVISEL